MWDRSVPERWHCSALSLLDYSADEIMFGPRRIAFNRPDELNEFIPRGLASLPTAIHRDHVPLSRTNGKSFTTPREQDSNPHFTVLEAVVLPLDDPGM